MVRLAVHDAPEKAPATQTSLHASSDSPPHPAAPSQTATIVPKVVAAAQVETV